MNSRFEFNYKFRGEFFYLLVSRGTIDFLLMSFYLLRALAPFFGLPRLIPVFMYSILLSFISVLARYPSNIGSILHYLELIRTSFFSSDFPGVALQQKTMGPLLLIPSISSYILTDTYLILYISFLLQCQYITLSYNNNINCTKYIRMGFVIYLLSYLLIVAVEHGQVQNSLN